MLLNSITCFQSTDRCVQLDKMYVKLRFIKNGRLAKCSIKHGSYKSECIARMADHPYDGADEREAMTPYSLFLMLKLIAEPGEKPELVTNCPSYLKTLFGLYKKETFDDNSVWPWSNENDVPA